MRKSNFWLCISTLFVIVCLGVSHLTLPVHAAESPYDIWMNAVNSANSVSKWYNGSDQWSSGSESPRAAVGSDLVEGVDYERTYWWDNTLVSSPPSDAEWSTSALGMKEPGFVWEKISGLGDYSSYVKYVRHNILTLVDASVPDQTKMKGDVDPEVTAAVVFTNNNPNSDKILSSDFSITREAGEEPGTYAYSITFNADGEVKERLNITYSTAVTVDGKPAVMIIGHNTCGYIYVRFTAGTLTILDTVDVEGTKTWNDDNDKAGKRPDSIIVNLLADGDIIDSATVTENDNWSYSFINLPKYDGEREIVYTVTEDAVEEYTTSINGYNITNTYKEPEPTPEPTPTPTPTPSPTSDPTPTATPWPQAQTCQDVGYPDNYTWNEDLKACVPYGATKLPIVNTAAK